MKNCISWKSIYALSTFVLSALGSYTAQAQTTYISGNQVVGNQLSTGYSHFFVTAGNGGDAASHIKIAGPNSNDHGFMGYMAGYSPNNPNKLSHGFYLRPNNDNDFVLGLGIHQNGQVQIGATTPNSSQTDYKLAVAGKLVTQSLYVTNPSTWADFVFEPGYQLMPLPSLENYLLKNKHLPYIPSAKDVETNGYDLADMNAKLLRTVEELTLQVIALSKQQEQVKAELASLRTQIAKK